MTNGGLVKTQVYAGMTASDYSSAKIAIVRAL
jgi:hypothetical protein